MWRRYYLREDVNTGGHSNTLRCWDKQIKISCYIILVFVCDLVQVLVITMSCYSKENLNRNDYNNVCKSHSARSDREIYRICPSKLSKRELEDLYFSLLENNLELKRTVNGQQDKIKGLSSKVQRMTTAQRLLQTKEYKDCCVGSKFLINEQRESLVFFIICFTIYINNT